METDNPQVIRCIRCLEQLGEQISHYWNARPAVTISQGNALCEVHLND